MNSTTYHCNGCITPLFKNEIIFYDARTNILIIKEESALNLKKINNNVIKCGKCNGNVGIFENTYKTIMINKNLVVGITIVAEEAEQETD